MKRTLIAMTLAATVGTVGCSSEEGTSGMDTLRAEENANTLYLLGGGPHGTFIQLAADMSDRLDGDNLRVIAMTGQGSVQALRDLLFLEQADVVMMDNHVREHNIRNNVFPEIDLAQSVQYISTLYPQEIHIVARDSIASVMDLEGKRVNYGNEGSGTFLASTIIFNELGLQTEQVNLSNAAGVEAVLAGEIDATVRVAGQPTGVVADIPEGSPVHLLELTPEMLSTPLFPSGTIRGESYPNFMEAGETVATLSSPGVLAVLNPADEEPGRAERIDRFIEALFANFEGFQDAETFHPKWQEVDIVTDVPGWTRHATAQRLLDSR